MNIQRPFQAASLKQRAARRDPVTVWALLFVIGWSILSAFAGEPYSRGAVHTWGMDAYGMIAIPEEIEFETIKAVSAGVYSMALSEDGQIFVWGDESPYGGAMLPLPEILSGKRIVSISAGATHALALTDGGEVIGWGRTYSTGLPVPELPDWAQSGIEAVAAGSSYSLALTADTGRLWFWGPLGGGNPVSEMPTEGGFKAISAGLNHCLALTDDGRVVAWGANTHGQTDVPEELSDGSVRVKKISAGTNHNLALTEDGQIWGWGSDTYGEATEYHQFYGFKDVASGDQSSVALTLNDTVLAWGWNENDQAEPPEKLTNKDHPDFVPVIAISAGWNHALALTSPPKVATPVISTEPFATQVNVTLSCSTEGATIYYTLDGSDPTIEDGTPYGGGFPIAVIEPATIKVRAFKEGYSDSDIAEEELVFLGRAIAISDVDFGNVAVGETGSGQITIRNRGQLPSMIVSVSIDSEDEGVFTVYFSSTVPLGVGEEITVNASFAPDGIGLFEGTIKLIADSETRILGDAPTATGTGVSPSPPTGLRDSGRYYYSVNMELESYPDTSIFFRTFTDEWSAWDVYSRDDEIRLDTPGTIRLEAKSKRGEFESAVMERTYEIFRVNVTPTMDFGEVEVGTQATLNITLSSEGGLDLTLEGAKYLNQDWKATGLFGDEATWPLELASDGTAELTMTFDPVSVGVVNGWAQIGFEGVSGLLNLPISGTGFTVPQVANPSILPISAEGLFVDSVLVYIITATDGAEIRYTLDGSIPDADSILYQDPILITTFDTSADQDVTVRAIAFKDGYLASEVVSSRYEVLVTAIGVGVIEAERSGSWAFSIDPDRNGVFLAYINTGNPAEVLVMDISISEEGRIEGSALQPLDENVRGAVRVYTATSGIDDGALDTLTGEVHSDGSVSGEIKGWGTFSGNVDLMNGIASDLAGSYEIDLLYRDVGKSYAVVGSDGTVTMVIETPDRVEGCRGILDSSGHVVMTTSQSSTADLTIGPDRSMTLMLTPQGSTEVAEFLGLADVETGMNRLINLSTRGYVGTQSENMIAGFVITGTGSKPVLIRAMGPTLADPVYGVPGVIQDPRIEVKSLDTDLVVATNDDWEDTQELLDAILVTGAFPASGAGSKDAMVLTELDPGRYTAKISGVSAGTGVAIVEVYTVEDLDTPEARQVNISTRGFVGTGGSIMILGLKADGNMPRQFLIRAVGPTLGMEPFNLPGVLTDPVLTVVRISDGTEVATNDDWDEGASGDAVHALSQQLGAFALPRGSKDAVVLISLPTTSGFTVKVSGKNGETGVAIAEVYEVP